MACLTAVSYTHLDVYKRQGMSNLNADCGSGGMDAMNQFAEGADMVIIVYPQLPFAVLA